MTRTGVFATKDEITVMKKLADAAYNTPVIMIGNVDLAGNAWDLMKRGVHELALAHGLPEIPGYYGADLKTGEFVAS